METTRQSARAGRHWRLRTGWMLFVLAALPMRAAHAQEDATLADTAAARALAIEGVKLADAGKCADAIDKLSRAEKLHHAPIVLGRLGECQIAEGKIIDGTENLRRVVREPLPPNASAALSKARDRAQAVLEANKGKIPTVVVSVSGGPRDGTMIVTFDGKPLPSALLDAERPTDPGEHVVEGTAPGFSKASARVVVGLGEKQTVTLKLDPEPAAAAPSPAAPAPVVAPPPSAPAPPSTEAVAPAAGRDGASVAASASPHHTGAYLAWAAGGAAIVGGGVFGAINLKDKSDLDKQCPNGVCPFTARDRLDSASRAGTISTVLFVAGGVGVALGTILFFIDDSSSTPRAAAFAPGPPGRAAAPPSSFRARPIIGLGSVGLAGDF